MLDSGPVWLAAGAIITQIGSYMTGKQKSEVNHLQIALAQMQEDRKRISDIEARCDKQAGEISVLERASVNSKKEAEFAKRIADEAQKQVDFLTQQIKANEDAISLLEKQRADSESELNQAKEHIAELKCRVDDLTHERDELSSIIDAFKKACPDCIKFKIEEQLNA